jgi:hypothetical protein
MRKVGVILTHDVDETTKLWRGKSCFYMVSRNALTRMHLGRVEVFRNFVPVIATERQREANDDMLAQAYGQVRGSAVGESNGNQIHSHPLRNR